MSLPFMPVPAITSRKAFYRANIIIHEEKSGLSGSRASDMAYPITAPTSNQIAIFGFFSFRHRANDTVTFSLSTVTINGVTAAATRQFNQNDFGRSRMCGSLHVRAIPNATTLEYTYATSGDAPANFRAYGIVLDIGTGVATPTSSQVSTPGLGVGAGGSGPGNYLGTSMNNNGFAIALCGGVQYNDSPAMSFDTLHPQSIADYDLDHFSSGGNKAAFGIKTSLNVGASPVAFQPGIDFINGTAGAEGGIIGAVWDKA